MLLVPHSYPLALRFCWRLLSTSACKWNRLGIPRNQCPQEQSSNNYKEEVVGKCSTNIFTPQLRQLWSTVFNISQRSPWELGCHCSERASIYSHPWHYLPSLPGLTFHAPTGTAGLCLPNKPLAFKSHKTIKTVTGSFLDVSASVLGHR